MIYFYASALALFYVALMIMSYLNTVRYKFRYTEKEEEYLKNKYKNKWL